jgi:hypothetical protein
VKVVGKRPYKARLGLDGYARILVRIRRERVTMAQLMEEGLIASFSNAHALLAAWHRLQRIHIADWQEIHSRPLRAVWAYGSGEDAQPPEFRTGCKKKRRAQGAYVPTTGALLPSYLAFESLLVELETPRTVQQLVDRTELDPMTIRHTLAALKPLAVVVGKDCNAPIYQLRDAIVGKPQKPRLGDEIPRVASVFHLGQVAANEARRAA